MHAVLVWAHIGLMMVAFGASPLGRLGLRYLLPRVSGAQAARDITRAFSRIFLAGGISVTAGVCIGLVLAWPDGLTRTWILASVVLIGVAGLGGVAIENRWVSRLSRAEGEAFTAILGEKTPLMASLVSPALWLCVLWLMIAKPG
jgi:hypothetical protein